MFLSEEFFPVKLLEDSDTNLDEILLSGFLKYSSAFSCFVFGLPRENPSVAELPFRLPNLCSEDSINSSSFELTELVFDFSFSSCLTTTLSWFLWVCSETVDGKGLIWFMFFEPLNLRICSRVVRLCFLSHKW